MKIRTVLAVAMVASLPVAANATTVSIEELTFDLDQFIGAYVTTDSSYQQGVLFDNAAGVDGYTVGELAAAPGGSFSPVDPGDQLSLGNATNQEYMTLHYGQGILIGPGDASLVAVYEQASSNSGVDEEGHYYEIKINDGSWIDARVFPVHQTAISTNYQNRVVFDLLSAPFGLSVGDELLTISIRNILGSSSFSDPDIVFVGRAGVSTIDTVPLPASLPMLASAVGIVAFVRRRLRQA